MKALISKIEPRESGWRVAQVVEDNQVFPVAEPDMFWVDFPTDGDLSLALRDLCWYDPVNQTIQSVPLT